MKRPGATRPARTRARARRASTPHALIAAGRRIFARHGYDGASVRAITEAAGANLGAITYHFGSKRGLYDAVVASCIEPFADRFDEVARGPGTPLERLAAAVRACLEHLWINPDLPFLMMQEMAAGRLPPPAAQHGIGRLIRVLGGLVIEGQADGSIRGGDPVLLGLSLIAQPVHLTLVRRATRAVIGVDQDDPETRGKIVAHVVDFVTHALRAERLPS
jgi:AcrR family transcriptional regulator